MAGRSEIWPLIAGVALATFTPRWAPWGLGLLAGTWLIRWLGRGRLTVRTPIDGAALLLALTVPAALWATTDRAVTWIGLSRLLAGLALAYGLVNWASPEVPSGARPILRGGPRLSLLAQGLSAVGLGLALYSLVAVSRPSPGKLSYVPGDVFGQAPLEVEDRVNPNVMAGALVTLLPYPLALAWVVLPSNAPSPHPGWRERVRLWLRRTWLRQAWFAGCALGIAAVLVLTKTRGAWVAAGAAIVVWLASYWRWALAAIPAALLGVGLALWRLGPRAMFDALAPGGDGYGQWMSRVEIWSRAIYMIQDFPYTGAGVGTFGRVADTLYPFFLHGPEAEIPHAHNLLLQVAVDLGLPGLVAYLAILLLALWSALDAARRWRRAGEKGLSALAWAGLASLVAMLVHGTVDATTWIVGRGAFVPWAVIGTVLAVHRPSYDRYRQEAKSVKESA